MHMRALVCGIFLSLFVGLTAAGASADTSPPWTPLTRGGWPTTVPGGGNAAAFVIPSRKALDRFPALTWHPPHPPCSSPCEWWDRLDWKHDAVVLVVARERGEPDLYSMARRGGTLRVTIGPYPGQPASSVPFSFFIAVEVRKHLLGTPLPRRVLVVSKFTTVR
jgi:hypothetical protein